MALDAGLPSLPPDRHFSRPQCAAPGPLRFQTMRFPRRQKLGRAAQFLKLREEGRRLDTGPFVVWFRLRTADEDVGCGDAPRFAINASRKVGNSVVRNRMKRLLREAFRLGQETLPRQCDVWIQLKTGCDRMRPVELGRRLFEAARRFEKQGNRPPRSVSEHAQETPPPA